jgi:hypothetical protein
LYTGHGENQARKLFSNLLFFPKPAVEVLTSPEKTDGGYELRSRGPASQGFDALDIASTRILKLQMKRQLPSQPLPPLKDRGDRNASEASKI